MKTALLKLATRHPRTGVRSWDVPGFGNVAKLQPSRVTSDGWGPAFRWPMKDRDGDEMVRGVDLNRHRSFARNAARALLAR